MNKKLIKRAFLLIVSICLLLTSCSSGQTELTGEPSLQSLERKVPEKQVLTTEERLLSIVMNHAYWEEDICFLPKEDQIIPTALSKAFPEQDSTGYYSISDEYHEHIFGFWLIPDTEEARKKFEQAVNQIGIRQTYLFVYDPSEQPGMIRAFYASGEKAEKILSLRKETDWAVDPYFYYTDDMEGLPQVTKASLLELIAPYLQKEEERKPHEKAQSDGRFICQDGTWYLFSFDGVRLIPEAGGPRKEEAVKLLQQLIDEGTASFPRKEWVYPDQNILDVWGIREEEIRQIELSYIFSTETGEERTIAVVGLGGQESQCFDFLADLIEMSIWPEERGDVPISPYQLEVKTDRKTYLLKIAVSQTAETDEPNALWLIDGKKSYRMHVDPYGFRFFQKENVRPFYIDSYPEMLMRFLWIRADERIGEEYGLGMPNVENGRKPMMFWEELLEADDIFTAVVTSQEIHTDTTIYDYTAEAYRDHQLHLEIPYVWRNRLLLENVTNLKGAFSGEYIRVPAGEEVPEEGQFALWPYGISGRGLEEGKRYIFFMNQLPCEAPGTYAVRDYYLGVMEVGADGMLSPLFALPPEEEAYYRISLDELIRRIGGQ
ncbi:MAG: hypothetical protein IJM83_02445 [Firmicutes bacterium]|nr:hypothetical protein [Bacillota bacterium]